MLLAKKSPSSTVLNINSEFGYNNAGSVRHRFLPTSLPWKRHLLFLSPFSRNRSVLGLFAYLVVVAFLSYLLLAFFFSPSNLIPCLTCLLWRDSNNNNELSSSEERQAGNIDGVMVNSILQQLRERVVKLANMTVETTRSLDYDDDDDDDNRKNHRKKHHKIIDVEEEEEEPAIAPPRSDFEGNGKINQEIIDAKEISIAPLPLDPKVESAISLLQAVVDKPFTKDAEEFEKTSLHFYGIQTRLDHAFMKLLFESEDSQKRRRLKIAAVGGSITVGNGIPKKLGYFDHFIKWLSGPLKQRGIDVIFDNAAIGASGSEYFSMCITEYFNLTDIDILLVEFAFNDGRYAFYMPGYQPDAARPIEELLRMVWRQNPMIHIVLVNFPFIKNIFRLYYPPKCDTIEDDVYLRVAQHYQVTAIRWKHMFCTDNMNISRQEQKKLADIYIANDGNHPSSLVHLQMAEFLIYYFKTSLSHLIERLRIGRGATTVAAMMIADRMTSTEQASRLISLSPPIHQTTWIDEADCFASFSRPFKYNQRLTKSLLNASSDFNLDNVFTIGLYDNGSEVFADNLQLFILEKPPSYLSFRLDGLRTRLPCGGGGFEPRLAIVYTLCKDCSPGALRLLATFVLADHSIFNTTYRIKLKSYGYKTNFVHMLPPLIGSNDDPQNGNNNYYSSELSNNAISGQYRSSFRFCRKDQPLIESIHIRIEQLSVNYPLLLHAIIVAYDCCQQNQQSNYYNQPPV